MDNLILKQPGEAPEGVKKKIVYQGKRVPATVFVMRGHSGTEKIALLYKPYSNYASVRVVRLGLK